MKRKQPKLKFVNLHGHTCYSIFDGLGYPADHMDFAYENGLDALAITDHGHMNAFAQQFFHWQKMKEEGREFKAIFGVEAYFVPSIKEWEEMKNSDGDADDDKETSATIIEDEETKKATAREINRRSHLVLLAQNQKGLNNLFQLVSKSYERPNYYRFPRVDLEMLREHSEGIIATSACLGGIAATEYWRRREDGSEAVLDGIRHIFGEFKSIFGDRWFGELQFNYLPEQHELNSYVLQVCRELNIELVATADAHYPRPELWKDREIYKRFGWNTNDEIPETIEDLKYALYPKNGDEMFECYKDSSKKLNTESYYDDVTVAKAIQNTHKIAFEMIEDFVPDTSFKYPSFIVEEGKTADQQLLEMCIDKIKERGLDGNNEYIERLQKELKIIKARNLSSYFLTMCAIMDEGRTRMVIGPGRGSVCGSLLAYVLDISEVDPLRWDTQFERFLMASAKDYPDIDVDYSRNLELKEHLIELWGKNVVVPISNFNTLKPKSLIKDLAKMMSIDYQEVNSVTTVMESEAMPAAKEANGITSGAYEPTYDELVKYSPSLQGLLSKYPDLGQRVQVLLSQPRSVSRHAGGVVIADNLDYHMPLISSKNVTQTPWTEGMAHRHLEPLGFIKFDLLGLSTLEMFEECIRHILIRYEGIENPTMEQILKWHKENLHSDVLDFDDERVYEKVYHEGNFAGVFQFTERPVQGFCKRVRPANLVETAVVTSLWRPGPLGAGVDKDFLKAKENPGSVKYLNKAHEEVLGPTYGFLIFQEQIAQLASSLGRGIDLNDGNLLRKLLTKKGTGKPSSILQELKEKFIIGCVEDHGIERDLAEDLFAKFEFFAQYGFNKSHAIAYSMISYKCAWFLTHYPECWAAAYLTVDQKKERAILEVRKLGFRIAPPDINNSSNKWEISKDGKTLYQPLTDILGLGESAYQSIMSARPFSTIEDLMFEETVIEKTKKPRKTKKNPNPEPVTTIETKIKKRKAVNKTIIDVLTRCGALDDLIDNRFLGKKHFWICTAEGNPTNHDELKQLVESEELKVYGDFTKEEEVLNKFHLTKSFPLFDIVPDKILNVFDEKGIKPASEWESKDDTIWFVVLDKTERKTKTGKTYYEITMIDDTFKSNTLRIWNPSDGAFFHRIGVYLAKGLENSRWGFSVPRGSNMSDHLTELKV